LLTAARKHCAHMSWVEFRKADATQLRAGFRMQSQQVVPLFNPSYDPNTYSNRIIDLIVPFAAGRNGITRDEAEEWARDLRRSGEQGSYFFSLNRYLFVAQK